MWLFRVSKPFGLFRECSAGGWARLGPPTSSSQPLPVPLRIPSPGDPPPSCLAWDTQDTPATPVGLGLEAERCCPKEDMGGSGAEQGAEWVVPSHWCPKGVQLSTGFKMDHSLAVLVQHTPLQLLIPFWDVLAWFST